MPKHDFSSADVKRMANSAMPYPPIGTSRDRVGLVSAGNPDVLAEVAGIERGQRLKSGPAWHEGLRNCTPVQHRPGKNDLDQLNRGKPITF